MNLDIKTRLCRIGMKQVEVTKLLNESGISCYNTDVCAAINRSGKASPKEGRIRNAILGTTLSDLVKDAG